MTELGLTPHEQERLEAIEQQLREASPALDHALAHGVFGGVPDPARTLRTRSGWPVVVLLVLGGALVVRGLDTGSALALVTGTYVMALSFVGLWLPCRRRP